SAVLGIVAALLSDALVWLVKLIAHLGVSQILIGAVPVALVILYYCMIAFAGFAYSRRPLAKKVVCTVMILAIVGCLGGIKWQRTHRDDLTLTCLDVGHGQAILAQLPGTANILFDAGSLHRSDIGSRIVAPFLDYTGTGKIDAVIVSHNDADHINGIPEIAEHCKVGGVYANDAFFDRADSWGTAKFLADSLAAKGLEIERLPKDLHLSRSAEIKTLWPDEKANDVAQLSDNDRSLVTLIEFAGVSILLCSDIERFAQGELLRLYPGLRADVVVVPHHGSIVTLDTEFLKSLDADVLIYSCDRTQYERIARDTERAAHVSEEAKSFYTAENGAIVVRVEKDGSLNTDFFAR
ncbi:MAG: MBL fold metallo-hydrolase, partial [Planctomycetota bacterium]